MFKSKLLLLATAILLAACQNETNASKDKAKELTPTVQLGNEDIFILANKPISSGPVVTGSIQPDRKADLRAEISSVVLQVLVENGEQVKKGDLLVRLDPASIRDAAHSAEEAVRVSNETLAQAERQYQRIKTLKASGTISTQQLEDADIRRNNAQSDLVAAKARLVQARQQMQRTEIRAPFNGITTERKVSAGDTAQIGKELIKVIDPQSMRFDGLVSADRIASIKVGQLVSFHVNGYGEQEFLGTVKRIDPAANPATRQVSVTISINEQKQPNIFGLYAEGYILTDGTSALSIPQSALIRDGDRVSVFQINGNLIRKVLISIGEKDIRTGDFVIQSGLKVGEKILRNPSNGIKDGQQIQLTPSVKAEGAPSPVLEK